MRIVRACMATIGLVWRHDAVAVNHLRPGGRRAATAVSKSDGSFFSPDELRQAYDILYEADADKEVTVGFTEVNGTMLFSNAGELADVEFRRTVKRLVEDRLPGEVRFVQYKCDFELIETNWSTSDGENYRRAIRDAGRPAALDWLDHGASREAEAFLANAGRHPNARPSKAPGHASQGQCSRHGGESRPAQGCPARRIAGVNLSR